MKALIIAPQPFFTPRGTPFSVYYRTLVASQLNVEIDFLTYGEGQSVDIPGVRFVRIPRFKFLGNVKIGPSYLKLFLDSLVFFGAIGLLLRNRYDIVHAHEEAVFFCRFLKPIFGYKLVYDMHSSLPQQLSNFKSTTSKILISILKWLEDSALQAADAVITICPDLAEYTTRLIKDKEKHFLIENSIFEPVRLSSSENKDNPNSELPSDGRQLVVYAGTLEPYQGIDILINSFSKVISRNNKAFLFIIGGRQSQVSHYKKMAEDCRITQYCHFTGQLTQQQTKFYNSKASVLVSPRSKGTNTPLKIYEQLASGIPLVATNIYSHTQVLDKEVAILVKPEPDDMAEGILTALTAEGKKVVDGARRLYEEKYSRTAYEAKMKKLLETLA